MEPGSEAGLQARVMLLEQQLEVSRARVETQARQLIELEERLRGVEKLAELGLLVPGVAHEINNLLTGALGFTHLLGRSALSLETQENRMLTAVSGELNRCAALMRNLVHYSRNVKMPRERLELREILEDVLGGIEEGILEQRIELRRELTQSSGLVVGVRSQIEEVIKHLLNHARDAVLATGTNGWIRVRLVHEETTLRVEISDSSGRPSEGGVFEPLYANPDRDPGPQLGLIIAKSVMKDHGGRMQQIRGEEGATFVVRFPRVQTVPASASRV